MEELKSESLRTWSMILRFAGDLLRAAICALTGLGFTGLIGFVAGTETLTYKVAEFLGDVIFVGGALVLTLFGVLSLIRVSYESMRNSGVK